MCEVPGCERARYCRGLCKACYNAASRQVRLGKTTWDKLFEEGLVGAKVKRNPFTEAFQKRPGRPSRADQDV